MLGGRLRRLPPHTVPNLGVTYFLIWMSIHKVAPAQYTSTAVPPQSPLLLLHYYFLLSLLLLLPTVFFLLLLLAGAEIWLDDCYKGAGESTCTSGGVMHAHLYHQHNACATDIIASDSVNCALYTRPLAPCAPTPSLSLSRLC
jgi:hypothetical protein